MFKCDGDGCTNSTVEPSKWYTLKASNQSLTIRKYSPGSRSVKHLCGNECINRTLSLLMPELVVAIPEDRNRRIKEDVPSIWPNR